jgi:hypothetical protein
VNRDGGEPITTITQLGSGIDERRAHSGAWPPTAASFHS